MTNREADSLYRRALSYNPGALCDLTEVEEAVVTAKRCVKTFAKAIREREYHHARFFMDDSGHEEWIEKLRTRQLVVVSTAARLEERKASLAAGGKPGREAEATPVPDERRKVKAAPRVKATTRAKAAPRMNAVPKLDDALPLVDQHCPVSQRKRSSAAAQPHRWINSKKYSFKNKRAAHVTESRRIQVVAPSALELPATTENESDHSFTEHVSQFVDNQETQPLLSTSHRQYTDSPPSILAPACSPPKPPTFVCIAYIATISPDARVRCAKVSEGICGSSRCQEHQDEYDEALSALPTLEDEYGGMGQTIYDIHYRSELTRAQVMKDIAAVTRYISLADRIIARKKTLRRLDGCCSYGQVDMSIYCDTRDVYERLLARLKNTRSEFMRDPEPAPVVTVQPPRRYMQAPQTTDREQDTDPDQDTDSDHETDSIQPSLTPQRRTEDGGRVGAAIAAMVEGVVAHLGCACLH
ncbi:uncharacterized protein TRAVEDRAFT_50842 [Trametes versicolor FP-101664 SS1]|uniref:uncharacterized protein n=1 Tax=Trametes versicolor (strain FP-101664) TaxID=717944 RepID=UPI0004623FBC|nr:uncharacterized protein TRAVEDRAFT_50842 [Trametes versicolor FP-101664 SS1]EIW54699.1 hypothetical protein TRAVEDRAFT_50842 [Trametes versicolor FP-101664 SS1]